MVSVYHSLIQYQHNDWEEYLEKISLFDVFKELIKEYPDKEVFKCAIKFILFAYSESSDMVIINQEWKKNKQNIFEAAMVFPRQELYEDLVLLKNNVVVETIHKWLEYQDSDTFCQLQILKDLRVEMQISCLTAIKKPSGEVDYSQKFLNAEYSVTLKKMIRDLESELIQNSLKLKDAAKEIKQMKAKNTMGVEHFAK